MLGICSASQPDDPSFAGVVNRISRGSPKAEEAVRFCPPAPCPVRSKIDYYLYTIEMGV